MSFRIRDFPWFRTDATVGASDVGDATEGIIELETKESNSRKVKPSSMTAALRVRVVDTTGASPSTAYEAGDTIDGVTLAAGDLVLRATSGGNASDGIYVASSSGAAARHTGFDAYDDHPGTIFVVMEGTIYANTIWECTSARGGTLDSTSITITGLTVPNLTSLGAVTFRYGDSTFGTSTAIALTLGNQASGQAGVAKFMGTVSGYYGLLQFTSTNMHIDAIGGGDFYFQYYAPGNMHSWNQTYFEQAATTASAANAYLDNAASNQLKRSTSSAQFKRDVEDLDITYSRALLKARPVWYRSKVPGDNQEWSWYGFISEELAKIDPRMVQWGYNPEAYETVEDEHGSPMRILKDDAQLVPQGIAYDRFVVHLLAIVRDQQEMIEGMAARLNDLESRLPTA